MLNIMGAFLYSCRKQDGRQITFLVQHYIAICGLSACTVIFNTSHKRHGNPNKSVELDFLYNFLPKISHSEKDSARYCKCTYIGTDMKYSFSLSDFNTLRTGDADLRFYITTVRDG
jgi:hypothetical protein